MLNPGSRLLQRTARLIVHSGAARTDVGILVWGTVPNPYSRFPKNTLEIEAQQALAFRAIGAVAGMPDTSNKENLDTPEHLARQETEAACFRVMAELTTIIDRPEVVDELRQIFPRYERLRRQELARLEKR